MYATSASSNILAMDDMDMMHSARKDDAVSEVIGAVLLIAIVVIAVSIIGVVLWSQPPPQKIPSLSVSISNSSCNVTLIHGGGDTVENTYIALLVDGIDRTNTFIRQDTGAPWTSWGNGETLQYAPSYTCLLTPQRVDIIYYTGTSRTILTSGYFGDLFTTGGAARPPGAPMSPDFTGTPLAGFVPFDVQFTGTSTGSPIAWSWDFGDGGTSALQNPVHTYSGEQLYTVSLTVNNGSGSSIKTKTNYIAGYRPLIAEFTSDTQSGIRPLAVQFTDASLGSPVSWSWVFGDGGTSTVQSLPFTYLRHGRYSVSLTVTNATTGINSTTKTNYITVNPSPPWYCGWGYRKNITIDHTKVPADQTDFPVLISFTDSNLSAQAQTSGYDILFTSSDGTTKLSHEIEAYTSGTLVAWVKVPSLSSAANTTLFMYYGCATASDQQNKNGVWDTGFKGVWHLNQGTGVTAVDSTSNANSATPVDNPAASTGRIGGALTFSYPDRLTIPAAASLDLTTYSNWTMSAWVKPTSYTSLKWPIIYSYGSYRASMGLTVQQGTDGLIENWINDATLRQSTNPVTLNAWNYVTITRTATTTSFYLNGNADGSSGVTTVTTAGQPSGIGSDPNGAFDLTEQYLGLIDEVRLSASSTPSGARSGDWIVTEYRNQNSPSTFHYITGQEEWTC
jgi:PKD repeat protein